MAGDGGFFWGTLMVAFGAAGVYLSVDPMIERVRANSWLTTPGRVIESKLVQRPHVKGETLYVCEVTYEFVVNGTRHIGIRIGPGRWEFISGVVARKAIEGFTRGTAVTVHYNPTDPDKSFAQLTLPPGTILRLVGSTVFLVLGLLLLGILWLSS